MASVLVIVADPNIESLVGELIAFAGHRPVYDVTAGAGGESVRRIRSDIAVIDTALPTVVVDACLSAADEVGTRTVLMSSTASAIELAEQARAVDRLYFALPGGPKPLAKILDRAIATRAARPAIRLPEWRSAPQVNGSVHPALRAALASLARATLQSRPQDRRNHAALWAAITDYARQLKAEAIPVERVVVLVHDAVADCASVVGAEASVPALLRQSEDWTRNAYHAA